MDEANIDGNGVDRIDTAHKQLLLVLGFFPRVDTLLSVLLGLEVAMLGVVFARAPALSQFTGAQAVFVLAFLVTAFMTLLNLYRGSFPDTNGGVGSLVFFQAAAKLESADYVARYRLLSATQLADDMLHQAWRNSCILSAKFMSLKRAYMWLLVSALPWVVSLLLFPTKGA